MRALFAITIVAAASISGAWSAMTAADIQTAVRNCVNTLHTEQRFNWFDAYYNQASGMIETNILYGYQVEAAFPFKKCMASQGFPLPSSQQDYSGTPNKDVNLPQK
jgi:hypothetical protein